MIRIEDLLQSLVTVLIRYHDSQSKVIKMIDESDELLVIKKTREYSAQIFEDVHFTSHLNSLILVCTKDYPNRSPLLFYLLDRINFLKTILDRKTSFTPIELNSINKQASQMLIDLQQLFLIKKNEIHPASNFKDWNSNKPVSTTSLSGFINTAFFGAVYCLSGDIINTEVLFRLGMMPSSPTEEIIAITKALCDAHQNRLLVFELQTQIECLQTQVKDHQETFQQLTNEHDSVKIQLEKAQIMIQELKKINSERIDTAMDPINSQKELNGSEIIDGEQKQSAAASSRLTLLHRPAGTSTGLIDIAKMSLPGYPLFLWAGHKTLNGGFFRARTNSKDTEPHETVPSKTP
ncbi:MAG: hypothetical protein PSV35_09035 [bacterium]|nr:hypothetical protein [bacterium]